jgi:hypothetical protein
MSPRYLAILALAVPAFSFADAPATAAPPAQATEVPDPGALPSTDRLSLGLALDAGHKRYGNEAGVVGTARFHGLVLGLSWSHLTAGSNSTGATNIGGLVLGYGLARGPWRVELVGGWGGVSADTTQGGLPIFSSGGHYLSGRLGVDRRLVGGERWALTAGIGAWFRRVYGLQLSDDGWSELGYGLRIGSEFGL